MVRSQRHRSKLASLLRSLAPLSLLSLSVSACDREAPAGPRVVILGFDGLDYGLTRQLIDEGRLPNLARLAERGGLSPLATSIPPQSPVAWSSFITGLDPGGHGIYDFLHRDPTTLLPYASTSKVEDPDRVLKLGKYQIPLSSGTIESRRRGTPFWEVLEEHGVETTIIRMPANFPPSGTATRELSGMGTPDLLGSDGTFSFYTSELFAFSGQDVSGGVIHELDVYDNVVEAKLYGPDNPYLTTKTKLEAPFTVYLDPESGGARIELGDQDFVLAVGEWSDWAVVDFKMIPTKHLRGTCRFFLKQLEPEFELYVSPIDIDPMSPAMPISTPDDYAAELAEATGRFYTEGMPEDTKSLTEGVFGPDEFLSQANNAGDENIRQFHYVLDQFEDGLLFYYFGNVDQISHVMWRSRDPSHPAYDEVRDGPYADLIPSLYEELDGVVGHTLERVDEETLVVVMSDHGFTSWRRAFHLNTWLMKNGYLVLKNPDIYSDPGFLLNVDWDRTRAYAFGFTGLYLNQAGRERSGTVQEAERGPLLREIADRLLETVDPATGEPAVTKVHISDDSYKDRGALDVGPDIVLGYAKGIRGSNESALGELTDEILSDNLGEWSGDHIMDFETVPGILASNRPLKGEAAAIEDLAGILLEEFGITGFPDAPQLRSPE